MKVVAPTALLSEAADVLTPFRDRVVVVGATALEVALSDSSAAITPTRDIDIVIPTDEAAGIVADLERAGLQRSEVEHEAGFTWVRGELKVQLVRSFHPFPSTAAKALPQNPVFGMASAPAHQVEVAFADTPRVVRLRMANAACLLALKEAAFGRKRPGSTTPVERDYHDAYLLIKAVPRTVQAELQAASYEINQRARRSVEALAAGGEATAAAGREMVRLGGAETQRGAEAWSGVLL